MKIGLRERLQIFNIVKKEGSFASVTIVHDLLEKIKLTQPEIKKYEIKQTVASGGNMETSWNDAGLKYFIDIKLTDLEEQEIINALKELNDKNKITVELLPLCKLIGFAGEK